MSGRLLNPLRSFSSLLLQPKKGRSAVNFVGSGTTVYSPFISFPFGNFHTLVHQANESIQNQQKRNLKYTSEDKFKTRKMIASFEVKDLNKIKRDMSIISCLKRGNTGMNNSCLSLL